jgi:protein TonB
VESPRYIVSFAMAAVVTFGLFWLMQAMIAVDAKLDESAGTKVIDFVRLKRDTDTETKDRELPDRKPPEKEPPPPQLNLSQNMRPDSGDASFAAGFESSLDLAGGPGLGGLAAADTDAVPLVRVNPTYPMRAAQRGIEGWVEIEFTIGKSGTVKDPVVVGYEPSKIFNKAALQAIRKWKYNPKIEEGKAVERPGIIVRLRFNLSK